MRGETLIVDRPHSQGTMPSTLTAAVVASNELLCRGIAGLLRVIPEIGQVREFAGPDELHSLDGTTRLDLIIVTPGDAYPVSNLDGETGARILVVVEPTWVGELVGPVSRLADGFLWQPTLSAASLWEAVRRTLGGEVPVPPELTQALMSLVDTTRRPRSVNLTGRERQALALLVKGLSNKQIAKRLAISSHGAKRLVTSIMLKLDAPNRTLAAVTAIRAGLVDDDT